MAVKLMIDSASDISQAEAEKLGITMIPMIITIGEEEYKDGVNLLPNEFYDKLIKCRALPKTSLINSFRFEEAFEKLTENGDEVVVITISSKLSGTYASALQAAENYKDKVFVVDSLNACVGERLLGQYAINLINKGLSASEIAKELDEAKERIVVVAGIDTLEYLKKGGRISAAAAFVGNLLSIKPLIAVIGGEVKVVGKAIGSKKCNAMLNNMVSEKGGINYDMPYGVVWSGLDRKSLDKYMAESAHFEGMEVNDVPAYILGATIGTHVGPGAVGISFFKKISE